MNRRKKEGSNPGPFKGSALISNQPRHACPVHLPEIGGWQRNRTPCARHDTHSFQDYLPAI